MAVVSQNDITVSKQRIRNKHIKIDILNFQFQTVDSIQGYTIGGSISINANSLIRRQCSIEMVLNEDSKFEVVSGGRIWLDKYIKVFIGTEHIRTNEIIWKNMGIFMINQPSYVYSSTENTLSFEALDLMAKLTGLRNGNLQGLPYIIEEGSDIRMAMIAVLKEAGFTKYLIAENPQKVPYEIKVDVGGVASDLLVELRDISSNYEIYFDEEGTFIYNKIPSNVEDAVMMDDSIIIPNLLTESKTVDFENVKNVIEVFGKSIDPKYFGGTAAISGDTYTIKVEKEGLKYRSYNSYGFITPKSGNTIANPKFKINDLEALPLLEENKKPPKLVDDEYYVVKVSEDLKTFLFLGKQQIWYEVKDMNPDSPFYVKGSVGEIREIKQGGEYENIYTDDLARQRAEYELWLHTNMNNSITMSCVPILFADVNMKIEHAFKRKEKLQYIIKSISLDLNPLGTQTINAIRFYPLFPNVVSE